MANFTITTARTVDDLAMTRRLFQHYATWLETDHSISLDFQGFNAELASLPGKYAPPGGEILLAREDSGADLGCVAVRPFGAQDCEIKRLYVLPAARGTGLGRELARRIIETARKCGYRRALLDTGPFMSAAQRVYANLGFQEIDRYYDNPYPGCLFMALELGASPPPGQSKSR